MIKTECPKCGSKCVRFAEALVGPPVEYWFCGSDTDGEFNQSDDCRLRELERLLSEVLPLAWRVSCGPTSADAGRGDDCCKWRDLVTRIEAAGITSAGGS